MSFGGQAKADLSDTEPGMTFSGSSSGIGPAGATVGWSFSLDSARTVTHLGMYDGDGNPTDYDRQTGIWDSTGTLMGSVVFPAGSTPGDGYILDDYEDGSIKDFRYVALSVTLQAGTYNIGTYYPENHQPGCRFDLQTLTPMDGLTYLGTRYHSGGGWGNPDTESTNDNGYVGPNVRFSIAEPLLGDLDGDGDVDLLDFGAFQANFTGPTGSGMTPGDGDLDGDGDVDLLDFGAFQANFTGPGGGMTVNPEPATLALVGLGGLGLLLRRRRRR